MAFSWRAWYQKFRMSICPVSIDFIAGILLLKKEILAERLTAGRAPVAEFEHTLCAPYARLVKTCHESWSAQKPPTRLKTRQHRPWTG